MNSPRIAASYCVFDDDEWLRASIASIYPAVDALFFFVANAPWNGPYTDNSKTLAVIESFPDPENKIKLERGDWKTEVDQRNWACAVLLNEGFQYTLIIDADEVYDSQSLRAMIEYAYARPETFCFHSWFIVYWKTPLFRIDPPEKHHPPVILKLGTGGFVEFRNCVAGSHDLIPPEIGFCHHLSYARTDEQILRKINSFSHSHQVSPNWFEDVWRAWDRDQSITDLCPYNPGVFERAVPVPQSMLPSALRSYLLQAGESPGNAG